jgi:tetratricopeptide (TPR) repeat protein
MKRLLILAMMMVSAQLVSAQGIDEIRNLAILKQNDKAKEAVDKYLSVEKNAKKPDGWFYKGYILNEMSKDPAKTQDESSALKLEALETFKKYRSIDPKAVLMEEQTNSPYFDIYSGFASDLGVKAYQDKNYAKAAEYFAKALDVHDYVYSLNIAGNNGFKFSALDTTLVLYTAIAAGEAKNSDMSITYYRKLIDANIAGEQYVDVYQQVAEHYKSKKDHANLIAILEKARQLYPANTEYWIALEIEDATADVEKPALFQKYDELAAKFPNNYTIYYNQAVEIFRYVYSEEAKGQNTNDLKAKLTDCLNKSIAIKSTVDANFLMANFLYNYSIDISDEAKKIKGPKPDDLKKKKEMNERSTKVMNDAIPYAEKVVELFKAVAKPKSQDKINNRQALILLRNIYEVKKDQVKADMYDKLSKEAN